VLRHAPNPRRAAAAAAGICAFAVVGGVGAVPAHAAVSYPSAPYLTGSVPFEDIDPSVAESWGYLATPDPAAGTAFDPFVTATVPGTSTQTVEAYTAGHVVVLSSISEGLPFTVLAALLLRAADDAAVLWPTAATLLATAAAVPGRDTAVAQSTALMSVRAAAATARPWVHV